MALLNRRNGAHAGGEDRIRVDNLSDIWLNKQWGSSVTSEIFHWKMASTKEEKNNNCLANKMEK